MIVAISLPYNARYHKEFGAQLWFFYKQLGDFANHLDHLTFIGWEKNHISPELLPEICWEKEASTHEKLEFSIPSAETVKKANVHYVDQSIFEELEKEFKSNNLVWQYLMTREHAPLVDFLRKTFEKIQQTESIDAIILNCNLPSAKAAAKEFGIPVIHTEIGPTRKPQYFQTAYWDLCGVNGNTEAAERFEKAADELDETLLSKKELRALFMSGKDFAEANAIADAPDYEVGVAGQVDDDSNIIAYSNGFNNLEVLRYANFHFGEKNVLFRSHPAAQSYFTATLDRSPSTVHFFKRIEKLVTINSSMALEACLFNKPVMVMGDSPFKILSDDLVSGNIQDDGHIRELNFLLLNYIIPYELIFDYDYIFRRLSNPSESEIRQYHLDFYIRKKGFSSLQEFKNSIVSEQNKDICSEKNPVLKLRACDIPDRLLHEEDLEKWCKKLEETVSSLEEKCRKLQFLPQEQNAPQSAKIESKFDKPQETSTLQTLDWQELLQLAPEQFSNEDDFTPRISRALIPASGRKIKTIAVYYYRLHNGGVEKNISMTLKMLNKMGYKTILLTDTPTDEQAYQIPPETVHKFFSSGDIRKIKAADTPARINEWKAFIDSEKIDAVIYNASLEQHAIWDLLAVKLSGAHFIVHSHETCIMKMFSRTKFNALHNWKLADALICLSRVDAAWWKTLGCNAKYIPNFVEDTSEGKVDFSRSGNDILWIGRISEEKSPADAVRCLKLVLSKVPDARLIFVGKPEKEDDQVYIDLLSCIRENHLEKQVIFTGFTLDVEKYYRQAAVHISTSAHESFSLTVLEAKIFGIPTVAYDLPNIEPFRHGKGHITVERGNIQALADNIIALLSDRRLCEEMGREAFESLDYFRNYPYEQEWKKCFEAVEENISADSATPEYEDLAIAVREIMSEGESIFIDNSNELIRLSDKLVYETSYYQHMLSMRNSEFSELQEAYNFNKTEAEHYKKLWEYQTQETANFKQAYEYNESEAKRLAGVVEQLREKEAALLADMAKLNDSFESERRSVESQLQQAQLKQTELEKTLDRKLVKLALRVSNILKSAKKFLKK